MRYVVHLVPPDLLESYLNGATFVQEGTRLVARPPEARLVGVFQEDVPHTVYGTEKATHVEYRCVWEVP